jgi:hypothetical protein
VCAHREMSETVQPSMGLRFMSATLVCVVADVCEFPCSTYTLNKRLFCTIHYDFIFIYSFEWKGHPSMGWCKGHCTSATCLTWCRRLLITCMVMTYLQRLGAQRLHELRGVCWEAVLQLRQPLMSRLTTLLADKSTPTRPYHMINTDVS